MGLCSCFGGSSKQDVYKASDAATTYARPVGPNQPALNNNKSSPRDSTYFSPLSAQNQRLNTEQHAIPKNTPHLAGSENNYPLPTSTLIKADGVTIVTNNRQNNVVEKKQAMQEAPPQPVAAVPQPMAAPPQPMAAPPQPMAAPQEPVAAPQASKAGPVGDAYDMDDVDEDWKTLLRDVDARLVASGQEKCDAQERAVAVRTLIAMTASRGVQFAMNSAVKEITSYRKRKQRNS